MHIKDFSCVGSSAIFRTIYYHSTCIALVLLGRWYGLYRVYSQYSRFNKMHMTKSREKEMILIPMIPLVYSFIQ